MIEKLTLAERIKLSQQLAERRYAERLRQADLILIDTRPKHIPNVPSWSDIAVFVLAALFATAGIIYLALWRSGLL